MKIRLRLTLLLGCLLAAFGAATWLLHTAQRREAETIRSSLLEQRGELLDRLLTLTGQSLRSFANDYSLWDDMVAFVQTGDPAWAKINIDASLVNFDVYAAWVLRPDGSVVYGAGGGALPELPFLDPAFRERLEREKSLHFFLESPSGLLETRLAPIQPSADTQRQTTARGWLVATRLWNDSRLQTLSDTLQSQVGFLPRTRTASEPAMISVARDFSDWNDRRVRTLHMEYQSLALARLLEGNHEETSVLFFFGVAVISVTVIGMSRWVIAPLRQLEQSLEGNHTEPLRPLLRQRNEFGHFARLVEQSFGQRAALEREVNERRQLALALQETEAHLRESIELRGRLARDLHDGIIQSIYAAGLGLEGVRSTLRSDPAAADQRLAGCQKTLNDTIWEVRAFINSLEPELTEARPFRQTVATLVATVRSFQQGNITQAVDESVARRLGSEQELQVLHILRESISNALRHAAPAAIHLSLQATEDNRALLEIADDGCGFDPARHTGGGHGLINLRIRAREMGGVLQINSAPGKGTRITLRFTPTYPPCP